MVFHKHVAKHRVTNQAKALRKLYRTILIVYNFDFEEQIEAFDEIHFCIGIWHFKRILRKIQKRSNLAAVICGTQPTSYAAAILDWPRDWPLFISQYDSY